MQQIIDVPKWLSEKFAKYYSNHFIDVFEVEKREFGFGSYDKKIEFRHLAFSNNIELNEKLKKDGPLYISCSCAYYKYPAARPMAKKEYLGGDLTFDLDAPEDKAIAPFIKSSVLEEMKNKVFNLIEILEDDFGLSKKDIYINFSGSRGYHIWVFNEKTKNLKREARRELIDYIDGKNIILSNFFSLKESKIYGPKPTDYGYKGKIAKFVSSILEDESKSAKFFSKGLNLSKFKQKYLDDISKGDWTFLAVKLNPLKSPNLEKSYLLLVNKISELFSSFNNFNLTKKVEADSVVTFDTSKLLRVPNSLHGGSGLVAKSVNNLDNFEPFKHALAFSMQDVIKIKTLVDIPEQEFGNCTFSEIKKDQILEIQEAYAIYLICKKTAIPLA